MVITKCIWIGRYFWFWKKMVIDPILTIFTLKILKAIHCRQERTSYSWRQRILNLRKDKWKETSLEGARIAPEEKLLVLKDCLIQLWSQRSSQCLKAKPEKLKWCTHFKSEGLDSWANKEWLVLCQQLLDCVILVVFFFPSLTTDSTLELGKWADNFIFHWKTFIQEGPHQH